MRIISNLIFCNVLIFLLTNPLSNATDLHVGSGQTYATIKSAINGASGGDTIYIHAGTYTGNIDIDNFSGPLTIRPDGSDVITLQPNNNSDPTMYIHGKTTDIIFDGIERSQFAVQGASGNGSEGQNRMAISTSEPLQNIPFRNMRFIGNAFHSSIFVIYSGADDNVDNIVFDNCLFDNDFSRALEIQGKNQGTGAQAWHLQLISRRIKDHQ